MTLTTPALLFPAISLLLLAYTNRYLAIASLTRDLHSKYQKQPDNTLLVSQINNLRKRITLIRLMQALGVFSLFLCVFCMFLMFSGKDLIAEYFFGTALVLLMASLGFSVWEIQISAKALNIQLSDIEQLSKKVF
ncbi:DUF2721 domain-containing protein [Rapidithrix thailandica]|uniref:DUF2721 domain-containing protein n=1 Tax=Rapidithrix thailandica TaxID=413964 RepID=A0AAW9SCL8_9BACT